MKTLEALSAIICLSSICLTSQAITILDVLQNPANGHNYYLLSSASWTDSESFAQTLGGNLATINDAAENSWLSTAFLNYTQPDADLWIGLYNPTQDTLGGTHVSNFIWANAEPVTFTDWYSGEPNNTGGTEYYAAMRGPSDAPPSSSWNDLPNSGGGEAGTIMGVVEVVPEPQALALLAVGVSTFIITRRRKS